MKSSATTVATVPASVNFLSGQTTASFPINTNIVAQTSPVLISATSGGLSVVNTLAPEPLLAIARPPGVEVPGRGMSPALPEPEAAEPPSEISGIHMPSASVAPLVLGVGFCIAFLGLITNVFILIVGLVWMLAGAVGWIRIGLMEAAHASHSTEHEPEPVA